MNHGSSDSSEAQWQETKIFCCTKSTKSLPPQESSRFIFSCPNTDTFLTTASWTALEPQLFSHCGLEVALEHRPQRCVQATLRPSILSAGQILFTCTTFVVTVVALVTLVTGHWSSQPTVATVRTVHPTSTSFLKIMKFTLNQPISQSVLPRHPCKQMTSQMTPVYGSRWGYPGTNQTTKSPILFMCNIKYCIKPSHVDLVVPIVDPFPDSPHVFIAHTYDYW